MLLHRRRFVLCSYNYVRDYTNKSVCHDEALPFQDKVVQSDKALPFPLVNVGEKLKHTNEGVNND